MIFLGIDPGLSGALAILTDGNLDAKVFDTPILKTGKRRDYDCGAIDGILKQSDFAGQRMAALELIHAFPKMGCVASFCLGEGFGLWKGLLAAHQIPVELVSPQRWKKAMLDGLPKGKQAGLLRARELFPKVDLSLKKHDGRADALLLAEFARRLVKKT